MNDCIKMIGYSVQVLDETAEQSNQGKERDHINFNTLRTGDADLRFYVTTVQDG